ncbi:MAG TPA: AarF/UbiB family protein, partial [Acidimicrobiales bacterium]|nr:AarF/UbiB family protein [Acidimicrobiales bacterium]
MATALRFGHLRRYGEIGRLLVKYGRGDLAEEAGFELADELESLGPTFVKLGQLLSTRPDIVPPDFADALTRLQDDVAPMPYADVERVFTEELGMTPHEVFEWFDEEPLASASLGQVHRGRLANGHEVVVKVQRPDARARVEDDMAAIGELAQLVDGHTDVGRRMGFAELVSQFRDTVDAELDYRREASNLQRLAEIVAPYDRLVVPQPVLEATTGRVLTMDHVEGRKVTTLTPVGRTSVDGPALTEQLFRAYLDQILVHGFFHADPHPGNVLLTDDDRRLALLDLGMVATVSPRFQDSLVRLLVAVSEGRGEEAGRVTVAMGRPLDAFDEPAFLRGAASLVAKVHGSGIGDTDVGTLLMELNRVAFDAGLRQPPELAMLGKALLNLDQIAAQLDPSFDPSACMRDHAESVMRQRMR